MQGPSAADNDSIDRGRHKGYGDGHLIEVGSNDAGDQVEGDEHAEGRQSYQTFLHTLFLLGSEKVAQTVEVFLHNDADALRVQA